jgi:hypothetical protein
MNVNIDARGAVQDVDVKILVAMGHAQENVYQAIARDFARRGIISPLAGS